MSRAFLEVCMELVNEPDKLAEFVKLYGNKQDEIKKVNECIVCECGLRNYDDYYQKGFCSKLCHDYHTKVFDGTLDDLKTYINALNVDNDEERKIPFHFANYTFLRFADKYNYHISDEKLNFFLEHKNTRKAFIQYMKEYEHYDKYYIDTLTIDDLVNYNLIRYTDNFRFVLHVFNKNADKDKELEYETIVKNFREKNILNKFLNNSDKLDKLLQPYLILEDFTLCCNNFGTVMYMVKKFGIENIKALNPQTYMYDRGSFNYLYPTVTDDLLWIFVEKHFIHEHLQNYEFTDKNKFFSLLNKNKFSKYILDDYEKNQHVSSYFITLIHTNVGKLKKDDITLETFYNFCEKMYTINYFYNDWVCKMLRLFDDIDFSKKINNLRSFAEIVLENNRCSTSYNMDLITKIIDQNIYIKDDYIYSILYYCGFECYVTNSRTIDNRKANDSKELILKFDKKKIESLFNDFASLYTKRDGDSGVKLTKEFLISKSYKII